ncbi:MAG: hypothetical protein OEZ08_18200 [Betaproteobacteria bacterium]|nr:hypothetical protein [Betaproteobacteria bacterium]
MEIKIGSTIYDRINASRMSPAERQVAINAMHDAELLVDAFAWVFKKVEQLGAFLFLKPSIKH